MADARIEGLSVEDAINVIKQKHFKDLTPNDFAFLRARESYLSETDKAIYLEGEDPVEVLSEASGRAITREERIINENRPLQEEQERVRESRNAALAAEAAVGTDLTPEQRDERRAEEAEARKAKAEELREAADQLEEGTEASERSALEAEARELGVKFNSRTSDETLRKNVEKAREDEDEGE